MTHQETFDTVVAAILAQGKPSARVSGEAFIGEPMQQRVRCLYRATDGCKCAAGHLVPDGDYHRGMETAPADGTVVGTVVEREGHDKHFVRKLQTRHDAAAIYAARADGTFDNDVFIREFRNDATALAYDFGLNADVLA